MSSVAVKKKKPAAVKKPPTQKTQQRRRSTIHEKAGTVTVLASDRDEQILKLKLQCLSQFQIAQQMGVSQSYVSASLHRSLKRSQEERKRLADVLLQQELDRLDLMASTVRELALDPKNSVKDRTFAMGEWRKLMERRQKLLGMEVTTLQVRHEPLNQDEIERALLQATPIEIEKIRAGDTTAMAVLIGRVTATASNSASEVVVDAVIEEEF